MMRAKFFRERFLVLAASDAHGFKAHLRGKLDAQMPKATEAENGDQISGARAAVAQRIESSDAGAQQRPRIHGGKRIGNQRELRGGRQHEFGVATVAREARDLAALAAGHKIAAAARIAMAAM